MGLGGSEPKVIAELKFKDRVLQAAFSPDNRWVAFGSWDQTLKLLELTNPGTSKPIELIGHAGRIASVSFSPDSKWLVSASEDLTIRLWDPLDPSAAPVVLRGHEERVQHLGFSKDSPEPSARPGRLSAMRPRACARVGGREVLVNLIRT